MLEKKVFTGGMNKDTEDRLVPQGDWRDALNVRAGITEGSNLGSIENVKGNTDRSTITISGIGEQVIGSVEDKTLNRVFYFITRGSGTKDRVVQYDYASNTETVLISNNIFNFDASYPITSAEVIDQRYLVWTDNFNEPCFIDITKALTGGYNVGLTRQDVDLHPWSPLNPPEASYNKDTTRDENNLRGDLYQFRYRYIYEDGRRSAFSPISKVPLPFENNFDVNGQLNFNVQDRQENNVLEVFIDNGGQNVSKIELVVRNKNTGDWFSVARLDNDSNTAKQQYDFYNDEIYRSLNQAEVNEFFGYTPFKAKSLSFIGGNRLSLANIEEGYGNVDGFTGSAQLYQTGSQPGVTSANLPSIVELPAWSSGNRFLSFIVTVTGQVTTNASITIYYNVNNGSTQTETYNFTIQPTDTDNIVANKIATYFDANIPGVVSAVSGNNVLLQFFGGNSNPVANPTITIAQSPNQVPNDILPSFKRGTWHQFGIVYYDEKGRHGSVQTTDDMRVYSPWFDEASYPDIIDINDPSNPIQSAGSYSSNQRGAINALVSVTSAPPSWASKFQVVYTKNQNVFDDPEGRGFIHFIPTNVASVASLNNGIDRHEIELTSINLFSNFNENTPVNYEFVEGDRVRLITDGKTANYYTSYAEYEIVKYDSVTNKITIDVKSGGLTPELTGLIEIYRPSRQVERKVFYEIGYVGNIENGVHVGNFNDGAGAVMRVTEGDVYVKQRTMNVGSVGVKSLILRQVEDFHFSDFYPSNVTNIGKPNIVDEAADTVRRPTAIRYSDFYIPDRIISADNVEEPNTNVNGLGSFYALNFEEYDRAYGSIQHLYSEDKRLLCFQELKVGQILVNEQILSDQSGSSFVQKSDKVLSDIVYYAGEFGIGTNPESFAVYGFSKYFVDVLRGAVLRLSNDGITKISDYGMRTYFSGLFNNIIGYSDKIIGTYDERYGEYVLNIQSDFREVNLTLAFNDETNRWTSFYSFLPEWMETYGNSMCSFKGGKIYSHGDGSYNTFYGTKYNSTVTVLANEAPSNTKVYQAVMVESNDLWNCPSITNQVGQSTNLIDGDFEEIEEVYWANLLRDVNSRGGLVNGDDMRSPELKVKFENDSNNFVKLFSVGVRSVESERTNK